MAMRVRHDLLCPAKFDRVYRAVIVLAERGKPASDDDLAGIVERG